MRGRMGRYLRFLTSDAPVRECLFYRDRADFHPEKIYKIYYFSKSPIEDRGLFL